MAGTSFITDETPAGNQDAITVDNTAGGVPFTTAKVVINQAGGRFKRAVRVFVTVETAQIRVKWDAASTVSATAGHILNAGDSITVEGESNVTNFRAIRTGGSSGAITCTYYYNL